MKKKKDSDPKIPSSLEQNSYKGKTKSHSLPKQKPKSGRQLSRNNPNAGIYSIAPKITLPYKSVKPRT